MITMEVFALFIGVCCTAGEIEHKEDLGTSYKAHGRNFTGPAHRSMSTSC